MWDSNEETAIQSPSGGTKIAWGGPPQLTREGQRQRPALRVTGPDELPSEIQRLMGLGARMEHEDDGGATLFDPDGTRFTVCVERDRRGR